MSEPPDSDSGTLDLSGDVGGFFDDILSDTEEREGFTLDGAIHSYLVGVLTDQTRAREPGSDTEPLTLRLHTAPLAPPAECFAQLRELGDDVLFTTGFFADRIASQGVSSGYLCGIGAQAYGSASAMMRGGTGTGTDVLGELAGQFVEFVGFLSAVADRLQRTEAQTPQATLRLYERWIARGSAGALADLAALGLSAHHPGPKSIN